MSAKTDNIKKLKSLGVYSKWEANVLRFRGRGHVDRLLSSCEGFESLINRSFLHHETPEGVDFWGDISKK